MDYLDAELVNRVRQGDERAFETVYRRYYEMLCRFSAQLLHNPAMAEEVVDDVLFHIPLPAREKSGKAEKLVRKLHILFRNEW